MSRSYRQPYATDGYKSKWKKRAKRRSNKKVRRYKQVSDFSFYKKIYNSWDIRDWSFYSPLDYRQRRK